MDSTTVNALITTIGGATVGAWGLFGTRRGQQLTRENNLIDQIQEERNTAKEERKALLQEFEDFKRDVRAEIDRLRARDLAWMNFSYALIRHINDEIGPPAPGIPEDLR